MTQTCAQQGLRYTMMQPKPTGMFFYDATVVGASGHIRRPITDELPSQVVASLSQIAGFCSTRVSNFSFKSVFAFRSAQGEVGGSFDEHHNVHTTFASLVVEHLNIADVVTADLVVARLTAVSPAGEESSESTFGLTGSHFDNLRIAGRRIEASLATHVMHEFATFSSLEKSLYSKNLPEWMVGAKLAQLSDAEREQLADVHSGVRDILPIAENLRKKGIRDGKDAYLLSPVSVIQDHGGPSEILPLGSILIVPGFGVIRLAEVLVTKHSRHLQMLRADLGSPMEASFTVATARVNGVRYP